MSLKINKNNLMIEFDYLYLMGMLQGYSNPRDQVTKLIRSGDIIRVKKGIYVLGPSFNQPFSPYILGNIIYGPSYISGIAALSFYQFIPERVETITSTCMTKNKAFSTPVGEFTYAYINPSKFAVSINSQLISAKRSFLIASPEKTFVEILTKIKAIKNSRDILEWIDAMRIERKDLKKLRVAEIRKLQKIFNKTQVDLLLSLVDEVKKNA